MAISREDAAAELLRRGAIKPEELAAYGLPQLARQAQVGIAGPAYSGGPDAQATRQAWVDEKKRITSERQSLGPTGGILSQLDQFEALNHEAPTGGIQNWIPGINTLVERADPRIGTMAGIKSRLQGMARPVGSGATSDFEQRLYAQGVPDPAKTGPANQNIIAHMRATYAEENDRLAAQEAWLDKRGTLNGFQDAWTKYLGDQPYVMTRSGGAVRNIGNRKPWQEYFGMAAPTPGRAANASTRAKPAVVAGGGFKYLGTE